MTNPFGHSRRCHDPECPALPRNYEVLCERCEVPFIRRNPGVSGNDCSGLGKSGADTVPVPGSASSGESLYLGDQ